MRRTSSALLLPIVAAVVLATALVAGAAASSATSVKITSPKAGSTIKLGTNPYTAVAGTVSFAAATPQATRFYLRRDDCGGSNDNPHLSVVNGTDAGDGCGLVLTTVGPGGDADPGAFVDFPSTDGMPLAFDATQNVTGTIDLESLAGAGTGLLEVDVSMEALDHGNGVSVGSDTESVLITPQAADYPVAFTIQPNAALAGHDLSGIDLRVHVHGPFVFSGFIGNSGKSWTDVPSYAASVNQAVQVSLDDASFSNPVPARISGSTWSVAIPTPAAGKHTLYAESTQGFDTSAPASTTFTVKR
ncbi:MAG: hypothetical protein ACXVRE_00605 [Gaiellaceae bacterium]